MAVYTENNTKPINTNLNYRLLKQVVHLITTRLQGVKSLVISFMYHQPYLIESCT
jgi:hypothetical protein